MTDNRDHQEEQPENSDEDPRKRFKRLTDDDAPTDSSEEDDFSNDSEGKDGTTGIFSTQNIGMAGWYDQNSQEENKDDLSASSDGESSSGSQGDVNLGDTKPSRPRRESVKSSSAEIPDADLTQPPNLETESINMPPPVSPPRRIPAAPPPNVDKDGMPLPRRVTERDLGGTQVSPAAFTSTTPPGTGPVGGAPPPIHKARKRFSNMGCLLLMGILGVFSLVIILIGLSSFVLIQYYNIASTLPDVQDLRARASDFETTRILDRNGNLLYEIMDPNAGRRTYVALDEISPFMVAAIIATEDKGYYSNPGFSPSAILRAFSQNIASGETVSGASTITQQLARALLLSPEEASQISYLRKVKEAILAEEMTRRYSKDEILELYLNEIYFGNLAYGVEAAAETYFDTTADRLTLSQSAFLAGLPQAPSVYDIYTNRDVTLSRQEDVLRHVTNVETPRPDVVAVDWHIVYNQRASVGLEQAQDDIGQRGLA
ncbi:MAG: transglycosylase domain-containing protein [Chloroflexi bacterium]|nr:transglycosylase domain-containing protein [Chloroflexota bacterium]